MKTVRYITSLAALTIIAACSGDKITGVTDNIAVAKPRTGGSPAILASYGFEDGTQGPYSGYSDAQGGVLDYPNDPTPRATGKVARLRYQDASGSSDKAFEYFYPIGVSNRDLWFQGDFYIAGADFTNYLRKLIYWHARSDYTKYPHGTGGVGSRLVVLQQAGGTFVLDYTYNPATGTTVNPYTGLPGSGPDGQLTSDDVRQVATLINAVSGNTWYRLKVHFKFESALGAGDGAVQVWLDKVADIPSGASPTLRYSKADVHLTDPNLVGANGEYGTNWGAPMQASDIVMERYSTGEQMQGSPTNFSEYRYWDDVAFSTGDDFNPTLAGDTFEGTDGTQLTSHTPTGPNPGTSWTTAVGDGRDFELENGRARADQGGYLKRRDVLNRTGGYPTNYSVDATFVFKRVTGDDYFYIGARTATTGLAGYYFGYETLSSRRWFRLIKGNTSDGTTLGTCNFAYPAVDTQTDVELIVNGTTITGRVNGVDCVVATDSQYTSGLPSIYFNGATGPDNFAPEPSGIHLDNFVVSSQ